MVKAIINIDDHTNRILNIVKAKYGLKDKSAAIIKMAEEYEDVILEPELKPEYIEKLREIEKTEAIEVGTVENLRKRYRL
jgi:Zn-dependent M32 family carboxypeptidase